MTLLAIGFGVGALVGVVAILVFHTTSQSFVRKLSTSRGQAQLDFSPTSLSWSDVVKLSALIAINAAGQSLGLWKGRRIVPSKTGSTQSTLEVDGSEITLSLPLKIGKGDVSKFAKSLKRDGVDLEKDSRLLMLFFAAIATPGMLLLLASRDFPLNPVGGVNTYNTFEIIDPVACAGILAGSQKAFLIATVSKTLRPVKKGIEADLILDFVTGQGNKLAFRHVFTALCFRRHKYPLFTKEQESTKTSHMLNSIPLAISKSDPFLWAAVCKDYNPIHVTSIGARLFGLRSTIAHGNLVVARALALIDQDGKHDVPKKASLTAIFKRPALLPAKVEVKSYEWGFEVVKDDKVLVECVYKT